MYLAHEILKICIHTQVKNKHLNDAVVHINEKYQYETVRLFITQTQCPYTFFLFTLNCTSCRILKSFFFFSNNHNNGKN